MWKRKAWRRVAHVALHIFILFGGLTLDIFTSFTPKWIWPVAALASLAVFIVASRLAALAARGERLVIREEREGGAPSSNTDTPEDLPKIYTHWTAREILEAARSQTSMQAAGIVQSHLGKWFRVDGAVSDVIEHEEYIQVFLDVGIDLMISLDFEKDRWRAKLETVRQGDRLTAEGQIIDIEPRLMSIQLDDCEIIGIEAKGQKP